MTYQSLLVIPCRLRVWLGPAQLLLSESMSEDLSDAILGSGKENTFIEVLAGANGYVLVTDLPDASSATTGKLKAEAAEK